MGGTTGSELIPLFPLATPLFPGIVLPLQIFEPRYRRLVGDLQARPEADRRFGVVAIRQGWEVEQVAPTAALYDVGCTALLEGVRPRPDGGYRIVTVGADRFRLLDVVVGEDPPYLQGEVAWLSGEEAAEEAAAEREGLARPAERDTAVAGEDAAVAASVAAATMEVLVRGVRGLFTRYVAEVATRRAGDPSGEEPDATPELPAEVGDDPRALSFLVAAAALLTTEDRQALLAVSSTRRRLAAEARLLRRELTLLRAVGAVPVPLQEFAVPQSAN